MVKQERLKDFKRKARLDDQELAQDYIEKQEAK